MSVSYESCVVKRASVLASARPSRRRPSGFLLRRRPAMECVNVAAFAVVMGLAVALGGEVLRSGTVSLWDGFLYADALSALIVLLTAFVALVCSIYAVGYFRHRRENTVFLDEDVRGRDAALQTTQILLAHGRCSSFR